MQISNKPGTQLMPMNGQQMPMMPMHGRMFDLFPFCGILGVHLAMHGPMPMLMRPPPTWGPMHPMEQMYQSAIFGAQQIQQKPTQQNVCVS